MYIHVHVHVHVYMFLMRDEKKQARPKNNKAHRIARQLRKNDLPQMGLKPTTLYTVDRTLYYMYVHVHVHVHVLVHCILQTVVTALKTLCTRVYKAEQRRCKRTE